MTTSDAEGDVDNTDGVHFVAIDADGVAFKRANDIVVEFGVAT